MESTQPQPHLLNLPRELIHQICEALDLRDVRRFRLTCRQLAAIGACHALPIVTFFFHRDDFGALRAIANHPVYPKYVKTLIYDAEVLEDARMTYRNYVDDTREFASMRSNALRARRAATPTVPDAELRAKFKAYKIAHAAQKQIVATSEDFQVLREVIAKFPNLDDILMSVDFEFRKPEEDHNPDLELRGPFDKLGCATIPGFPKAEGVRHLSALLAAVQAAGRMKALKSIRAGSLHYSFFDHGLSAGSPIRIDGGVDMFHNLTRFELSIHCHSEFADEFGDENGSLDDDDDFDHVEECRRVMRTGVIRKLLRKMPNLEVLSILFSEHDYDDDEAIFPASLSEIIPADQVWPNLETLKLGSIETDREELVAFLVRHKESLMSLSLQDIRLIETSWLKLLPQLKAELEPELMEDVWVTGVAYGQCEDEFDTGPEEWEFGDGPEFEERPDRKELAYKVHGYLMNSDRTTCPLTAADNMYDV
ncbi:hypothetical protein B0T22DRAFT_462112 [Podospora appendiculata]|uniref:F-box domain-containing protein n=1 Tax=Podospora appendiculata TaxID=314037 RepID=A0AAE1CDP2_9PEZI|nr:hypothetical protein B0T22DRAFT_462112 [Podospora appendiculata]